MLFSSQNWKGKHSLGQEITDNSSSGTETDFGLADEWLEEQFPMINLFK